MSKFNNPADATEALSAPLGDFIALVGKGVADAQRAMDMSTIATFREIYAGNNTDSSTLTALREMGYQPTWYKIPEVEATITMSLSLAERSEEIGSGMTMYTTPMDAIYANKYDYNLQAASQLKFKVVPVPPNANAENMKVIPKFNIGQPDVSRYKDVKASLDAMGIQFLLAPGQQPRDDYYIKSITPSEGEVVMSGQIVMIELSQTIE